MRPGVRRASRSSMTCVSQESRRRRTDFLSTLRQRRRPRVDRVSRLMPCAWRLIANELTRSLGCRHRGSDAARRQLVPLAGWAWASPTRRASTPSEIARGLGARGLGRRNARRPRCRARARMAAAARFGAGSASCERPDSPGIAASRTSVARLLCASPPYSEALATPDTPDLPLQVSPLQPKSRRRRTTGIRRDRRESSGERELGMGLLPGSLLRDRCWTHCSPADGRPLDPHGAVAAASSLFEADRSISSGGSHDERRGSARASCAARDRHGTGDRRRCRRPLPRRVPRRGRGIEVACVVDDGNASAPRTPTRAACTCRRRAASCASIRRTCRAWSDKPCRFISRAVAFWQSLQTTSGRGFRSEPKYGRPDGRGELAASYEASSKRKC